nr:hypothetical protein MmNV_83 [Menippe mercenaria nudivirus]
MNTAGSLINSLAASSSQIPTAGTSGTAVNQTAMFPSHNSTANKITIQKTCNSQESGIIDKLFSLVPYMFHHDTLSTILKIYEQEEFNVFNLSMFTVLMKCPLFVDYVKVESEEKINAIEFVLNIYFNGISSTRLNINPTVLKNKICSLLKISFRIPAHRGGLSIKNPTVSISSNYKKTSTNKITASSDIANIIKQSMLNPVDTHNATRFTFVPYISNVTVQGPILKNLANSVINMQTLLMETALSHGAQIEPFIENNKNKFAI